MIQISEVSHSFGGDRAQEGYRVLNHINLTVEDGTFVSFLGTSGCGKTTLLRIANGVLAPTEGEVRIDGEVVTGPSTNRAMVFQEFNLMPWRTALSNVEMPHQIQGVDKKTRQETAKAALRKVGLERFFDFYPHQLSGGMKQRVGLARALSINPSYLFMDEPFGALDPQIREIMQVELMKIWDADRKTVVFVTHSVDEAVFLSDRVIMFGGRPSHIMADIHIDLPHPRWKDADSLKATPEFARYRQQIWKMLQEQISPLS